MEPLKPIIVVVDLNSPNLAVQQIIKQGEQVTIYYLVKETLDARLVDLATDIMRDFKTRKLTTGKGVIGPLGIREKLTYGQELRKRGLAMTRRGPELYIASKLRNYVPRRHRHQNRCVHRR